MSDGMRYKKTYACHPTMPESFAGYGLLASDTLCS